MVHSPADGSIEGELLRRVKACFRVSDEVHKAVCEELCGNISEVFSRRRPDNFENSGCYRAEVRKWLRLATPQACDTFLCEGDICKNTCSSCLETYDVPAHKEFQEVNLEQISSDKGDAGADIAELENPLNLLTRSSEAMRPGFPKPLKALLQHPPQADHRGNEASTLSDNDVDSAKNSIPMGRDCTPMTDREDRCEKALSEEVAFDQQVDNVDKGANGIEGATVSYPRNLRRWESMVSCTLISVGQTGCTSILHPRWQLSSTSVWPIATMVRMSMVAKGQRLGTVVLLPRRRLVMEQARLTRLHTIRHPDGRLRNLWDVLTMFVCLHDAVVLPLHVFELPVQFTVFQVWMATLSSFFWTIDMFLSFISGYQTVTGVIELHPRLTASRYVRTWFPLDIVITLNDWINIQLQGSTGIMRTIKAMSRSVRVFRLVRIWKQIGHISEIFGSFRSEECIALFGIAKSVMMIFVFVHYLACTWYWVASRSRNSTNWISQNLQEDTSLSYAYTTSLHWALTQFTPASMEVVPVNATERIFAVVVVIVSLVVLSSVLGGITQAMTGIRQAHFERVRQEALVRKYFAQTGITSSYDLSRRVWHFLANQGCSKMSKSRLIMDEVRALRLLPGGLLGDIKEEAYEPQLAAHPLFRVFTVLDDVFMRKMCCQAISEVSLRPCEDIYSRGQPLDRMLFVVIGELQYSYYHKKHICVYADEWACEEVLWSCNPKLEGPFVSGADGCNLITIWANEFAKIVVDSTSACLIGKYARLFIKLFNSAGRDPDFQDVLFNDWSMIHGLVEEAACSENIVIREDAGGDDHWKDRQTLQFQSDMLDVDACKGYSWHLRPRCTFRFSTNSLRFGRCTR